MNIMRKIHIFTFGVLLILTASIAMLVTPRAEAEAPKCYSVETEQSPWVVTNVGCDNAVFVALAASQLPGGFTDNHCYIIGLQGMALISALPNTSEWCINAKANAVTPSSDDGSGSFSTGDTEPTADTCGSGDSAMGVSINIGCRGQGNGIVDLTFAIIRFLSIGVGIIAVASMIVGGIQYTASSGNPEATAKAISRLSNTAIALLIYFLIFAILNWLVPGGVF